jgi:triacylglycerol lipase
MMESLHADRWFSSRELSEFPEPELIRLKHPVLLCHGYGALVSLVKPSPLYDVAMLMRRHHVLAFAPNIVPYATIETRAARWVKLIQKIIEQTGAKKLNIIAHSMGGLDMRFALSQLNAAPKVASLTTVSTPHRGSSLAERGLNAPAALRDKVIDLLDWMGNHVYPGDESDAIGSVEQLTRQYITENFNPCVPDIEDIPYYSYSASVGKDTDHPITVISRYQNNYIFEQEGLNDGMVSIESARWGQHIKTIHLSHLEQMNLRVNKDRQPLFDAFWLDALKILELKGH